MTNVNEIIISVKMHLCTFLLLSLALAFGPALPMVSWELILQHIVTERGVCRVNF